MKKGGQLWMEINRQAEFGIPPVNSIECTGRTADRKPDADGWPNQPERLQLFGQRTYRYTLHRRNACGTTAQACQAGKKASASLKFGRTTPSVIKQHLAGARKLKALRQSKKERCIQFCLKHPDLVAYGRWHNEKLLGRLTN